LHKRSGSHTDDTANSKKLRTQQGIIMRFRIILSLLSLDERIEAAGEEEQEATRLSDIANDRMFQASKTLMS